MYQGLNKLKDVRLKRDLKETLERPEKALKENISKRFDVHDIYLNVHLIKGI